MGKPYSSDLRERVVAAHDALDEMVERLQEERDVTIVRTAVWKFLDRHGRTRALTRS